MSHDHLFAQLAEHDPGLISHDLRSPLSSIINSASLSRLLLEKHGVSEGAKPVDMILRSSRRMAGMVDDLLETTRSESMQLQLHKSRFDLSEFSSAVLKHLGAEASRRIRL